MKKANPTSLKVGDKVQFADGLEGAVAKLLKHCLLVKTTKGKAVVATFKSGNSDINAWEHGSLFMKKVLSTNEMIKENIEVEIKRYFNGWGIKEGTEKLFNRFRDLKNWYGAQKIKILFKEGEHGVYQATLTKNF